MKANQALIAWTPADMNSPTTGQVKVGRLLAVDQVDWTRGYLFTGGAAYTHICQATGLASIMWMLLDFHTLVVRDGIDPQVAHRAFLAISEYAQLIAPDIKGARAQSDALARLATTHLPYGQPHPTRAAAAG